MKSILIPIGLTCVSVARGDFNPVPLTPGSFNADVVVEKTAEPPIENFATAGPDGGTNLTGNVWFESGYYPTVPGWGLPPHGTSFVAQDDPATNHVFLMPPDYTTNNALFISGNNGPSTGTLTLVSPATFAGLSILNSSGNGGETINYTVHHQDGSTETGSFVSTDWFHGLPAAWATHCLVSVEGGNLQQIGGNNGDLYENDFGISSASPVVSIDFTWGGSGGRMNVFAISGATDGVAFTNTLALTGFNQDMVIESNAPNFSMNVAACTATMERGTNLWGKIYFEKGFGGQTGFGLPPAGSTTTNQAEDHAFELAPSYTASNAMLVAGDGFGPTNGMFTLTTPTPYTALSLLCGATWGPKCVDVTVQHQDGSSESFPSVSVPDWWDTRATISASDNGGYPAVVSLITAAGFQADNSSFDTGNASRYRLFAVDLTLGNTTSPVTSVGFVWNTTSNPADSPSYLVFIFGVAGSTGATTPAFLPALVTGYNADMVVERTAVLHPNRLSNATTVSMDGGTNNTGNTWFEQGYYKQFPLSGLPPAGSTVHSIALPSSYQMPASYTVNNAAFIDAAHPIANLAPLTPTPFTALSILSSDANGRVTNQCIMQFADGTQEVNTFVSQDWFNNNPYAFSSLGRVNLDNPSINNDPGHTTTPNPRLYEAQFGLGNTTSPLTNVVLSLLGAQNTNSGRMVVLAVSAATGPFTVIIRGISQSTNTSTEGVNLTLSCSVAGGTPPITYNWQVQSNGVWVNLTDGVAGVSGSSTLTSTIATYPGWMTNAGSPLNGACPFRLQAANPAGAVFSATATVTLRSVYPDLPVAGDPITAFGGNTGDAGPPGNLDDLVGQTPDCKCLWVTPNSNPVNCGFVTTPSVGSSIAKAIRLYTANDAQGRDPTSVVLEGSNDGGNTWFTVLDQSTVSLSATRNAQAPSQAPNPFTQQMQELDFYTNTAAYSMYRVTFPTVNTPSLGLVQIGEVEILGLSLNTAPPFFTVQPPAAQTVFVGASPTFVVAAGGAPTLRYQWYRNNLAIAGATAPAYTLANAGLGNSGNQLYCQVQNANGSTNSSSVALTVIAAPTQAYPVAVLGDHPFAYYRLDEGPDDAGGNNGKVANDYLGAFFGTYSNAVLGVPGYATNLDGDSAALFGQFNTADSMVDGIGLSFAVAQGQNAAFSVEAWVLGSAAQTTDAGIITVGYGGFEQLNLDCGGSNPAHNFRFYVRDAAGNTHGPGGTKSPNDLLWHHVVGVCDEPHGKVVLYVDGVQNAVTTGVNSGLGILSPTTPLTIGARRQGTTTDYNLQFQGTIDEVALYNYALNSTQVLAHYFEASPAPVFSVQPTNTTANEGSLAGLFSDAYGPGTVSFQWYESADGTTFIPMPGQTDEYLNLPNVSAAAPPAGQNGAYYEVVATNAFGSVTSGVVQLTVLSGPPFVQADLPSTQWAIAGSTVSLSVNVGGTVPFTFQWMLNGTNLTDNGRISGSHTNTLTIANVQTNDVGAYQLSILNAQSGGNPTLSTSDTLAVLPVFGFNGDGTGWRIQGSGINNQPPQPRIVNDVLTMTDNGLGENGSAYLSSRLYIAAPFMASFTYQAVGGLAGAEADGICFVLQNDPRGPTVLSGGGGSFGIAGVAPSVELELNIYPPANGGEGIAFNVNGNLGNYGTGTNLATAPVILDTGDHINVVLTYVNNGIHVTLTDAETRDTFSASFDLNLLGTDLPTLVGGDMAYVGFSGADGGVASFQQVSNFRMVSLPVLSAHAAGPNTLALSWPQVFGTFILQSTTTLNPPNWQNMVAPLTAVGGLYQMTVSPLGGNRFFRLSYGGNVTVAPPIIAAPSRQGANLLLTWTGGTPPYQVQMTTTLIRPEWQAVGGPISGTSLQVPATDGAAFYRITGQ